MHWVVIVFVFLFCHFFFGRRSTFEYWVLRISARLESIIWYCAWPLCFCFASFAWFSCFLARSHCMLCMYLWHFADVIELLFQCFRFVSFGFDSCSSFFHDKNMAYLLEICAPFLAFIPLEIINANTKHEYNMIYVVVEKYFGCAYPICIMYVVRYFVSIHTQSFATYTMIYDTWIG